MSVREVTGQPTEWGLHELTGHVMKSTTLHELTSHFTEYTAVLSYMTEGRSNQVGEYLSNHKMMYTCTMQNSSLFRFPVPDIRYL
jgi:hypothetical protein